jgi:predicted deacylase
MMEGTQIETSVDFHKPGKQQGYLRVPYSSNEAAWANVLIPITVVQNGAGPTLLALGGNHGDEYEGPVALMKLARSLQPEDVQGRVILIPALNLPAVQAGTRLSPLDGLNLNRAFPGSRNGPVTAMIAHYVTTVLFPLADIVMDIHCGGKSLLFVPCADMDRVPDGEQLHKMAALARVWGTRYVFLGTTIAGEGLLPIEAQRQGKIVITAEMGGAGQCDPRLVRLTEQGIRNVLIYLNILAGEMALPPEPVQFVAATQPGDYHLAPSDGIYESFFEVGEMVRYGEPLGQVHFADRIDQPPEVVTAQTSGLLVCRRFPALARVGDVIATVARPVDL